MRLPIPFVIAIASTFASAAQHELKLTPANVHWGYYDARVKPVLTVKPGDSVRIETLLAGGLERLKMVGIPESEIPEYMKRVESAVTDRGPGAHPLTGPIYVEGAEPGDVLEVEVPEIGVLRNTVIDEK